MNYEFLLDVEVSSKMLNYNNHTDNSGLQVTKCIKQGYQFQDKQLFDNFHWMINEAIRIGIQHKITSKLALRNLLYEKFKSGYNTSFIIMAVFKTHTILKNYRRVLKKKLHTKIPLVKKRFIIVDSCQVKLTGNYIHFSTKSGQFTAIRLNDYATSKLSQADIKIGSLIIRENEIRIPHTVSVQKQKVQDHIGIDMNFKNITTSDSENQIKVHDMSNMIDYKQKVKETLSHFIRNDVRIRRKLAQKYGKKQKDKEHNFLHNLANQVTSQNKIPVLERLKNIRNQGRKGNGKGKKFRFKLNSWSRFKLQHIIDYKSRANGIIPVYINPKGTSSKCSICEGKMILEENRLMLCSACGIVIDRDVIAARNILQRGMWFMPVAPQIEGMKQFKDADQIVVS